MHELLMAYVPLLAFGLIPVWIPLIAYVTGSVLDRLRGAEVTPAERAVSEAKQRSASLRTEAPVAVRTSTIASPRAA